MIGFPEPVSSLWQISLTVPLEIEEAVTELFRRHFSEAPSVYTPARTGKSIISVYSDEARPKAATPAAQRTVCAAIDSLPNATPASSIRVTTESV